MINDSSKQIKYHIIKGKLYIVKVIDGDNEQYYIDDVTNGRVGPAILGYGKLNGHVEFQGSKTWPYTNGCVIKTLSNGPYDMMGEEKYECNQPYEEWRASCLDWLLQWVQLYSRLDLNLASDRDIIIKKLTSEEVA